MNKQMYLVRGMKGESYEAYTLRVFEIGNFLARTHRPKALKITLTTKAPPALSVIPFRRKKVAVISVSMESESVVPELPSMEGFGGAFSVTEAIPVGYKKEWKDEEETPGIGLLTLFHMKKGIDYRTFIERWHNSHTPISLKLHPLWNYNRNVVKSKLTDHSFWYDGIVEEHFRSRKDLLNVFRFFGKPHRILKNMLLVYTDTRSFIDYKKMETYLVAEYHIVS
jgi:hypothetical protein